MFTMLLNPKKRWVHNGTSWWCKAIGNWSCDVLQPVNSQFSCESYFLLLNQSPLFFGFSDFFFLFCFPWPKFHSIQTIKWWSRGSLHVWSCRLAHFSVSTSLRRGLMLLVPQTCFSPNWQITAGCFLLTFANAWDQQSPYQVCIRHVEGSVLCDLIYLYCY